MKITANTIGNYSPMYIGNTQKAPEPVSVPELVQSEKINDDEKKFFMNLYPESKKEIIDYYFYKKSGKMAGVAVGSLFDRRG